MAKIRKDREFLINEYIKCLQEDSIPWFKGWESSYQVCHNGATERPYHGTNRMILEMQADIHEYKDPRWYTFNQAKKLGYHVNKNEKGTPITYPVLYKDGKSVSYEQYRNMTPDEKDQVSWSWKLHYVFNAAQMTGVPEFIGPDLHDINGSELVDKIAHGIQVRVREHSDDRACYSPLQDTVFLPEKERFLSNELYDATKLHELCHATGHPSRMNRDLSGTFGSLDYAKEELRAEIASSFLAQSLYLPMPDEIINQHKAYVQSWIQLFNEDPDELFKAISDAEKIEKYALEKGEIDLSLDTADKDKTAEKAADVKVSDRKTEHKEEQER